MAARLELPKFQMVDANGDPLSGGLLYTYIVGTTTEKATYTTAAAAVEQSNPIVLNSRGEATVEGVYGDGYYKLVLKTSAGSTIWTIPSIAGANESSLTTIGDYSDDFDAAITAIAATETTLMVDSASTMSAVVTVPATCTVIVSEGGSIDMGGNALTFNGPLIIQGGSFTHDATLTINKSFECGLYDIGWDPDYTVSFAVGVVDAAYPQWWGALGNGAHDDQPEIQAAISSLTKGTVRLVAGTYVLNTMQAYTSANTGAENGLLVIAAEVSIKGDGRDSSILDITLDDTFYAAVVVNAANGVTIEDIAITGTGTAYSSAYGGGARVLLSKDVVIRNCLFEDLRGIGINAVGNFNLAVGDTDLNYYCTNVIVTGCKFKNINGDGVYHYYSKWASVTNNYFNNCGYTDSIIFEGADRCTAANNIILNSNMRSILLNTGSSYSTVTGNTIYYDTAPLTGGDGIYLASVKNCVVSGNYIEYNTGLVLVDCGGIGTIPGLNDITDSKHKIIGNILNNCGVDADYTAMNIYTDNNDISGNYITGGTHGISVDDCDGNHIQGNDIRVTGYSVTMAGKSGRADPTNTYVLNNFLSTQPHDEGTGTIFKGNYPTTYTLTLNNQTVLGTGATYVGYDSVKLDSASNAVNTTLSSGYYVGQIMTFVMTEASTSSTLTITNHQTSDPEVATFDAVDEAGVFMWTGTEWITIFATCTFV